MQTDERAARLGPGFHRASGLLALLLLSVACDSSKPAPAGTSATEKPAAVPAAAGAAPVQVTRAVQSAAQPAEQDFAAFWAEFRAALLASDWAAAQRMTRFPVEVHGDLDDDPVRKVEQAKLPQLLQKLLAQSSGRDETTVRDQLQQTATPELPAPGTNQVRVNDFHFERSGGQWRFVATYLSSDIEL